MRDFAVFAGWFLGITALCFVAYFGYRALQPTDLALQARTARQSYQNIQTANARLVDLAAEHQRLTAELSALPSDHPLVQQDMALKMAVVTQMRQQVATLPHGLVDVQSAEVLTILGR